MVLPIETNPHPTIPENIPANIQNLEELILAQGCKPAVDKRDGTNPLHP